jgi:NAD(P)-dependent dehydrogenase (short-subunit alcohol dehydrogenase family)
MALEGRVYVVSGAAAGIGLATAGVLLERGAAGVCITDLDEHRLEEAARNLGAPDRVLAVPGDVRDEEHARQVASDTRDRFGRLDGLVNNAGVVTLGPVWELKPTSVRRELDVNVTGTVVMSQAVGRVLRASGGGAIVNVASNCGKVGYPNMAGYNASKAAVINLTRSLAAEWADAGINVNAVCPGGVDTPMLAGVAEWLSPRLGTASDELLAGMGPAQLGRLVQPVEVGRVIAWLLSDDAVIVRGQAVNVDAGDTPY